MNGTFSKNRNRFASFGVIASLSSEIIDSIWLIIDLDLQGLVPLRNLLTFGFIDNNGNLTVHFTQEDDFIEMDIDLPFKYSSELPSKIYAYDDGNNQTILLPTEIKQE